MFEKCSFQHTNVEMKFTQSIYDAKKKVWKRYFNLIEIHIFARYWANSSLNAFIGNSLHLLLRVGPAVGQNGCFQLLFHVCTSTYDRCSRDEVVCSTKCSAKCIRSIRWLYEISFRAAAWAILKPLGLQMVANNTYTIKTGQYVIKAMASFKNLLKWFSKYFNYSDNPFFSRVLRSIRHTIFVCAFLTTIIVCPYFKMSQLNVLQARKTFKVTQ